LNENNERVFKTLAERYLDAQGQNLLRELDSTPRPQQVNTARMDQRVRYETAYRKRRRAWIASGLAACLLLVALTASSLAFIQSWNNNNRPADPTSNYTTTAPSTAQTSEKETPDIAAVLPTRLSVSAVEQDRGQSIYLLDDRYGDNVVLILEHPDKPLDTSGLVPVRSNGRTAYYRAGDFYNLMTFDKDGTRYTMTCRYEMDTLAELSENILRL